MARTKNLQKFYNISEYSWIFVDFSVDLFANKKFTLNRSKFVERNVYQRKFVELLEFDFTHFWLRVYLF